MPPARSAAKGRIQRFALEWTHRVRLETEHHKTTLWRRLNQRAARFDLARRMATRQDVMATGRISGRTRLPAALLGLRLGTAELPIRALAGHSAFTVWHQWLPRQQLEWSSSDDYPTGGSGIASALPAKFDLHGAADRLPVTVQGLSTTFSGVSYQHGWIWTPRRGGCDRVLFGVGAGHVRWHAWLCQRPS